MNSVFQIFNHHLILTFYTFYNSPLKLIMGSFPSLFTFYVTTGTSEVKNVKIYPQYCSYYLLGTLFIQCFWVSITRKDTQWRPHVEWWLLPWNRGYCNIDPMWMTSNIRKENMWSSVLGLLWSSVLGPQAISSWHFRS